MDLLPVEMLASMVIKYAAVLLLGASAVTILVFETILNVTSMFNHANIRIPAVLDRLLRLVVVTPAMHRVHYSFRPVETRSNFGFNLPWWDRSKAMAEGSTVAYSVCGRGLRMEYSKESRLLCNEIVCTRCTRPDHDSATSPEPKPPPARDQSHAGAGVAPGHVRRSRLPGVLRRRQ